MNYFEEKNKEFSFRDLIYEALIFIEAVGVIVYLLSGGDKFNYQFDIDKPQKYGQLMTTFDFPICKDDQVVKREQDSILVSFQPYFQLDENAEKEVIKKLKNSYQTRLRNVLPSTDYIRHVEKILSEMYRAGILSTEELGQLHKDSTPTIMVINDKLASQRDIGKPYSVKQTYAYLLTADTVHYQPNILRQCSLNGYLSPSLTYGVQRTETAKKEVLDNYSWANDIVLSGQKIIGRGEIVNQETYNILESLCKESIQRSEPVGQEQLMLTGQVLYVNIFVLCFILYLDSFHKGYYNRKGSLSLLFAPIMSYCVVTIIMAANNIFSVYIVPYAMLPIIIRVFLDSGATFLTQVVTILICSICLCYPYEFILLQFTAGLIAIFSLRELSQRPQLSRTAILVIPIYMAVYFAFELITENDLLKLSGSMYIYFMINGVSLFFTYPLLFLVEKTFGFTSNVTLVELSNVNNSPLRRMSETIPGMFRHSMQVASFIAEAANRIGTKSQLAHTGALYHDIGEVESPVFFTENQSGSVDPHKNLSYEQGTQVIISYVTDRLKLAGKNSLPKVIRDFITTHHDRGKTEYFYISWKNEHPDEGPNDELFTYPGPNPFTRERVILMMADSIETASCSLSEYTEASISSLVDKVIDSQVEEGYFKECLITFENIATVKAVFEEKLKTIYHTRISCPELREQNLWKSAPKNAKEQSICCEANGPDCTRLKVSVLWNGIAGTLTKIPREEKAGMIRGYSSFI